MTLRIRSTPEYTIEVWPMLYNFRLVVYRNEISVDKGYCFFGVTDKSLQRAIQAGIDWEDPLNTDPPDWDKRAFPDPAYNEEKRHHVQEAARI